MHTAGSFVYEYIIENLSKAVHAIFERDGRVEPEQSQVKIPASLVVRNYNGPLWALNLVPRSCLIFAFVDLLAIGIFDRWLWWIIVRKLDSFALINARWIAWNSFDLLELIFIVSLFEGLVVEDKIRLFVLRILCWRYFIIFVWVDPHCLDLRIRWVFVIPLSFL